MSDERPVVATKRPWTTAHPHIGGSGGVRRPPTPDIGGLTPEQAKTIAFIDGALLGMEQAHEINGREFLAGRVKMLRERLHGDFPFLAWLPDPGAEESDVR